MVRLPLHFTGFLNQSVLLLSSSGLKQSTRSQSDVGQSKEEQKKPARRRFTGMGQLSLVEHALCPLDSGVSLRPNAHFDYEYYYTDRSRHQRLAKARIYCPAGLSAFDDFFLWGLLSLTFSQPEQDGELHATPHYCLRQLGLIDQHVRRGGRQYRQFADVIERLSLVRYQNDAFYDPVRAEHRRVSFGFLSYSLPLDPESSRAWRIVWDPIFFEFVRASGGHLRFDLEAFRKLDPASRRLFLFASKLFARRSTTPRLDLRHLAVNVMGFQSTMAARDLKRKIQRCITALTKLGVFAPADNGELFRKKASGVYTVVLARGPYFERRPAATAFRSLNDTALHEPLVAIGLDDAAIVRMLRQYPARIVREWADITLAAKERFGASFFRKSPQAYFVDNVQTAAQGTRCPPDWWRELRDAERGRRRLVAVSPTADPQDGLDEESRALLDRVRVAVFDSDFSSSSVRSGSTAQAKPQDLLSLEGILRISPYKKQ